MGSNVSCIFQGTSLVCASLSAVRIGIGLCNFATLQQPHDSSAWYVHSLALVWEERILLISKQEFIIMTYINKTQWSLYVPHSGHYMYRTVVTICTARWSLYVPHSGHYMYHTVVTICTASLTFNNSTFCQHSLFMFCVDLRTNSDYFPIQH